MQMSHGVLIKRLAPLFPNCYCVGGFANLHFERRPNILLQAHREFKHLEPSRSY